MANFGKIILFRIEGLVDGNGYYPKLYSPSNKLFVKNNVQGLRYTARKDYRIIGKNYKLIDDSLQSVVYDRLGDPEEYDSTGMLNDKNYFSEFKKVPTNPDELDKVEFTWTSDPLTIEQLFKATPNSNISGILSEEIDFQSSYAQGITNGFGFLNHNLSLPKPLMSNQKTSFLDQYGVGDNLKIKPVYNYYLKEYEEFYKTLKLQPINNFGVFEYTLAKEKSIPNFYYIISLISAASSELIDMKIPANISGVLKGIIPGITSIGGDLDFSKAPIGETISAEIISKEQVIQTERNSVVVVTPSFYKGMANEIKLSKDDYPFYNEISIPITKGGTVFRDLFKKAQMYEQLQYRAALQIKIINKAALAGLEVQNLTTQYNIFYTDPEETETGLKVSYKSSDGRDSYEFTGTPWAPSDNIPRILEFDVTINPEGENYDFKQYGPSYVNFGNYVSTRREVEIQNGKLNGSGVNFNLSKGTENIELFSMSEVTNPLVLYSNNPESENNYIGSVIQNQANSILEYIFNKAKLHAATVFNNVENYSEILFFEVQKLDTAGDLVQTFILPNDPSVGDFVTYIDSQILYGKTYVYKIYAHTISIGNKMTRKDPTLGLAVTIHTPIIFDYENDFDIKLLRVPYYNTEEIGDVPLPTVNLDSPPVPPQITFYPFKNVNDKIGFWFNIGLDKIKMRSLTQFLEPSSDKVSERVNDYQTIRLFQALNGDITIEDSNDFKMLFKTDDFGGKIEIFRLTEKPENYSDFANNKISDVDVVGPRTLLDNIVPNQDYYYTFRHIDVHGLASNPTPVYHFKMITGDSSMEAGSVRVGVDGLQSVLFNELIYLNGNSYEDQKVEKSFKKYLLIEPTLAQTYLSFQNFENDILDNSFNSAEDIKLKKGELKIGKGGSDFISVKGKKFKIRVTSKQTGRKIDLNVDFKNLSVIENYKE